MHTPKRGQVRAFTSLKKDGPVHRSVAALMKEALTPDEKPEEIMRRKCREMVRQAKARGWNGPAYDPEILASLLGIKVRIEAHGMPGEGWITEFKGRVIITVRPGTTPERQRFTICHELAHTQFPDAYESVRARGATPEQEADKKFESLCDVGAAELLMPHEDFSQDMRSERVSLDLAASLGSRYGASLDAAVRRLVGLTEHPCAAAFLTDLGFGIHCAEPGILRVKSFNPSGNFRAFPKPGTSAPANSCVHSARKTATVPVVEKWSIDTRMHDFHVEAIQLDSYPGTDYPKFLTLLHERVPE